MEPTIFGLPGQPTAFAYIFFVISMVIGASGSIFVKRHAGRTKDIYQSANSFNFLLVLFEMTFFLVASIVVAGISGKAAFVMNTATLVCALLRAVCYVLGMLGFLMAVRHGPLLLAVIICRVGLVIPILLSAVFWPDTNTVRWYMAIGICLLFLALALFNKKEGTGAPLSKTTPAFWFWAITGAIGNGTEGFAIKLLENWYGDKSVVTETASLENCLFYASILQLIIFAVILLVRPPQRTGVGEDGVALPATEKPRYTLSSFFAITFLGAGWILGYALTNATSFYTSSLTIEYLPVVFYFMANTGFSILFAFLIARFIFRERLRPLQYVGVVVAVVGMILLNDWDSVFVAKAAEVAALGRAAMR